MKSKPDRKVNRIVACIAVDPKTGLEGIMAVGSREGDSFPLVFTEGNPIVDDLKELAIAEAKRQGLGMKLRTFEQVSEETLL